MLGEQALKGEERVQKCPICGQSGGLDPFCSACGYDRTADFVRYPTLVPVSAERLLARERMRTDAPRPGSYAIPGERVVSARLRTPVRQESPQRTAAGAYSMPGRQVVDAQLKTPAPRPAPEESVNLGGYSVSGDDVVDGRYRARPLPPSGGNRGAASPPPAAPGGNRERTYAPPSAASGGSAAAASAPPVYTPPSAAGAKNAPAGKTAGGTTGKATGKTVGKTGNAPAAPSAKPEKTDWIGVILRLVIAGFFGIVAYGALEGIAQESTDGGKAARVLCAALFLYLSFRNLRKIRIVRKSSAARTAKQNGPAGLSKTGRGRRALRLLGAVISFFLSLFALLLCVGMFDVPDQMITVFFFLSLILAFLCIHEIRKN